MDKEWLFDRLRQPALLRKGDEARLRELIARYPYFAAPYLLLGKSLKDQEHPAFDSLLPLISLQAYDRKLLFRLIHESGEEPVRETAVAKQESVQVPAVEEKVFVETEHPAKTHVFEVNFAEVEKEETIEPVERAPEELPEIPFGWKPASTQDEASTPLSLTEEASTALSLKEENTEPEDIQIEVEVEAEAEEASTPLSLTEEASTPLSLTEENTEPEIKVEVEDKMDPTDDRVEEPDGHAERSRSVTEENTEQEIKVEAEPEEYTSNYQLPTTNYQTEETISRTDFFHWLDKLGEDKSNYQLPSFDSPQDDDHNKVAGETVSPVEKEPEDKEQLAIIDRFIETNPSVSRMKTEFFNPVDKARESERLDDNLITETLARIFVAQEKYERAIAAYEKLQLKFPEKSDYFAALIEELKEKLN